MERKWELEISDEGIAEFEEEIKKLEEKFNDPGKKGTRDEFRAIEVMKRELEERKAFKNEISHLLDYRESLGGKIGRVQQENQKLEDELASMKTEFDALARRLKWNEKSSNKIAEDKKKIEKLTGEIGNIDKAIKKIQGEKKLEELSLDELRSIHHMREERSALNKEFENAQDELSEFVEKFVDDKGREEIIAERRENFEEYLNPTSAKYRRWHEIEAKLANNGTKLDEYATEVQKINYMANYLYKNLTNKALGEENKLKNLANKPLSKEDKLKEIEKYLLEWEHKGEYKPDEDTNAKKVNLLFDTYREGRTNAVVKEKEKREAAKARETGPGTETVGYMWQEDAAKAARIQAEEEKAKVDAEAAEEPINTFEEPKGPETETVGYMWQEDAAKAEEAARTNAAAEPINTFEEPKGPETDTVGYMWQEEAEEEARTNAEEAAAEPIAEVGGMIDSINVVDKDNIVIKMEDGKQTTISFDEINYSFEENKKIFFEELKDIDEAYDYLLKMMIEGVDYYEINKEGDTIESRTGKIHPSSIEKLKQFYLLKMQAKEEAARIQSEEAKAKAQAEEDAKLAKAKAKAEQEIKDMHSEEEKYEITGIYMAPNGDVEVITGNEDDERSIYFSYEEMATYYKELHERKGMPELPFTREEMFSKVWGLIKDNGKKLLSVGGLSAELNEIIEKVELLQKSSQFDETNPIGIEEMPEILYDYKGIRKTGIDIEEINKMREEAIRQCNDINFSCEKEGIPYKASFRIGFFDKIVLGIRNIFNKAKLLLNSGQGENGVAKAKSEAERIEDETNKAYAEKAREEEQRIEDETKKAYAEAIKAALKEADEVAEAAKKEIEAAKEEIEAYEGDMSTNAGENFRENLVVPPASKKRQGKIPPLPNDKIDDKELGK